MQACLLCVLLLICGIAFLQMVVGDVWELYCPPTWAYSRYGLSGTAVGPMQTVIFQVELLTIEPRGYLWHGQSGNKTAVAEAVAEMNKGKKDQYRNKSKKKDNMPHWPGGPPKEEL